ncbi:tetratricopeptide repeat protein 29-like isoform X1 [Micropterus salmoides]|uniref:tetratricopeptide repeat protein 29-like isoform X1 n=1 Tax=Micropterus salmoides TaxID=27706 RepID=UPI0018EB1A26|nr:tetratricopeptide repeat protein 29-like isoform X1 [Micropterus salmoides]XP_038588533.1 tetratricopeptide repeat protein 29-like isoform X1 [Micropterus salmoides]XP_038588534.1 tetratricopeptide repeat protein 29-like isoform X1 [Micropterus salmoides]XP_038588536.1 tetratricopeptide repeat protein 29-like isoform X1 [Micropterus salmoides]XP_038588537.1 tetratricopeptide repeat protein 29-like isoform X1 [Micropterus salmoides]XP_038588538.1 tetratricopeptide repeat protein 29-like isof
MNGVVTQRHMGPFLPEITAHSNKQRRSTQYSRMKQKKGSLQTGSLSDSQILSKTEIALFRSSRKQNICVEMLQEGYHRSFSELFGLLSSDQDRRIAAEPGSAVRLQTPLDEQWDKLETMRLHLCQAEQAERIGSWSVVCEQRLVLGQYFSAPEDLWLSFHFYHSCVDRKQGGCSRPATEARACMAELYLQQGELEQARQQAEQCIKQAEDGGWIDSAGRPLRLLARQALWRIYSRLADASLDAKDYNEALKLLHKGYSTAAESEDKQIEGEASYRLGLTYQNAGHHDTAKQFFNTCIQIYGTLQDEDKLGRSYMDMAKSLESEGNIDETVQCLNKLADISRNNGLQNNLVDAYLYLGNIYYTMGQYERACEYFLQGYEVACDLEDVALLQKAQVLVASARAHSLIRKYSADVVSATPTAVRRLLAWKETRGRQEISTDSTDNTAAVWY